MNFETQAVNTYGLWYAYVSVNGENVYQSKEGFENRDDAVADGRAWLAVQKQKGIFNQPNGLDNVGQ